MNVDWMAPFTLQFVVVASLMGIVSALVLRDMDSYEVVSKGREYGSHNVCTLVKRKFRRKDKWCCCRSIRTKACFCSKLEAKAEA